MQVFYGMAGIMYQIASDYPELEVEVVPGITAACSGAAVLGAPLISDLL
jgi:precorrin-3B C17-methyltransferase